MTTWLPVCVGKGGGAGESGRECLPLTPFVNLSSPGSSSPRTGTHGWAEGDEMRGYRERSPGAVSPTCL